MPISNYIAATHNITHSPCTSTCTTHPPLPSPLPSTTLPCTQLTNAKYTWQNGTRCRDGVNVLWCHSLFVWLVFEGSIDPTCACFPLENFFVTLYNVPCAGKVVTWLGHGCDKHVHNLASFPGLPTIQFLISCSMQKWRGKAIYYHVNDTSVYLGGQRD